VERRGFRRAERRRFNRARFAAAAGLFAWSAQRRWRDLPLERRNRLRSLLRRSGGRPSRLSEAERRELLDLVRELHVADIVRDAAVEASPGGRYRRPY